MGAIYLLSLADWCREAVGAENVIEEPSWMTRGRGSGGYTKGPLAIGVHHTASKTSPENDKRYMWHNADAKPIGAVLLDREGKVHVGCAGATNTQGKGKSLKCSTGTIPENKQNEYVFSIEGANAGTGEAWPQAQQDAYVNLCAVLCMKLGLSVGDIFGHFESAPGRKADPAGPAQWEDGTGLSEGKTRVWNMDAFRGSVLQRIAELQAPTIEPLPEPIIELGSDIDMQILKAPARIYDSRTEKAGKLKVGEARTIKLPKDLKSASAIHVTATVAEQEAHGFLTIWDGAGDTPLSSNLNFAPGNGAIANTTITAVKNGEFKVYTQAVTHVIFDVVATD